MTSERFTVQHAADTRRYLLIDTDAVGDAQAIGEEAYVDVEGSDAQERVLFHTEVSENYAGQGLASVLVRGAVEQAIADGYRIVPVCPYVARWLPKHPEYAEHVVAPTAAHLRAVNERG